jgi:hypothetical protein
MKERLHDEYGGRLDGIANCSYECVVGDPPVEILALAQKRTPT